MSKTSVPKILVAGSLVLDILPRFSQTDAAQLAATLLAQGRLTESSGFTIYLGGEVGNTGLALRNLGIPVRLMSKVGDDVIGGIVQDLLKRQSCESRLEVMRGTSSTASIALALPKRDKSTIHLRGASQLFCASDFSPACFEGIQLFHVGYPTTMKHLYADQGKQLVEVMSMAKGCGVMTSMDTSLPDLKAEPGQVDWKPILHKLYPNLDLFLPSLEEALFMTDRSRYCQLVYEAGNRELLDLLDEKDICDIADQAIMGGVKIVLIKCGSRGMYLRTAPQAGLDELLSSESAKAWCDRELWISPYPAETVLSTTGAGDTAIAGFLGGLVNGRSPESTLSLAAYTAARCVASYDTISGIDSIDEMMAQAGALEAMPGSEAAAHGMPYGVRKGSRDLYHI